MPLVQKSYRVIFFSTLISTLLGAFIGLSWDFAIEAHFLTGLLVGGVLGFALGILICLFLKASTEQSPAQARESFFLVSSFGSLLFITGIASSLIALSVRLVFF
jgi:hypothetical protein